MFWRPPEGLQEASWRPPGGFLGVPHKRGPSGFLNISLSLEGPWRAPGGGLQPGGLLEASWRCSGGFLDIPLSLEGPWSAPGGGLQPGGLPLGGVLEASRRPPGGLQEASWTSFCVGRGGFNQESFCRPLVGVRKAS